MGSYVTELSVSSVSMGFSPVSYTHLVCRRRFEPEVFVVECFLSDNLPFGTGTYHGYFFLQQYAVDVYKRQIESRTVVL